MPNPSQLVGASSLSLAKKKRSKAVKAKALKSHELDSSPKAKYRRLRKMVRALVYENGALCDETARAQRLVLQAQEERRFLLQKLIQFEQQCATPAPQAAAAGTGARSATHTNASIASAASTAAAVGRTASTPVANAVLLPVPGVSLAGIPTARSVAPLVATPGTSTSHITPLVAPASVGRSAAPLMASMGTVRPHSAPVAVAVARGSTGRTPTPLTVVSATVDGLPTPLVVSAGTSRAAIQPSGTSLQQSSSQTVGALPSHSTSPQWRPAPALPSPRTSTPSVSRRVARGPRRLVSALPRDASGVVVLPLRLGGLTLQSLGRVLPDRPAYHSTTALYPVGFVSLRRFISVTTPRRAGVYRCAIEDGGAHPRFSITSITQTSEGSDNADPSPESSTASSAPSSSSQPVTFLGRSADECHRQLLQRLSGALGRPLPASCRVVGEAFFGLTHPSVQQLLQASAGAAQCGRYRSVAFEVTEATVAVPGETEPSVNGSALWARLVEGAQ
ncbi:transforming growth factor beta regulator 1-like [Amphibalanus amphitrite]|uniref:transforming growth factor beta regulator 1-like n=1 Tax=Amphibalanus amphitrite TaxID=1232801 RepID=UPI001C91E4FB|nr:transforming growth factor beta regulator 1-like [Amphibalanus amphitrite]